MKAEYLEAQQQKIQYQCIICRQIKGKSHYAPRQWRKRHKGGLFPRCRVCAGQTQKQNLSPAREEGGLKPAPPVWSTGLPPCVAYKLKHIVDALERLTAIGAPLQPYPDEAADLAMEVRVGRRWRMVDPCSNCLSSRIFRDPVCLSTHCELPMSL